ncbi:MAG: DNA-directed RNA polymerase subunit omega [Planctomycetes bacterium]|nr:DNA-directed RNA polymerase subunit omega [Planctomycetota bacterium]
MDSKMRIEDAIKKVGGRFKLTVLVQKRIQELNKGAPRLVSSTSKNLIEVVLEEILQDKIHLVREEDAKEIATTL